MSVVENARGHARRALLVALMLMIGSPAGAEVLLHCGASKGKTFYFSYGSQPAEWIEDRISNGRIILTRDGNDWDILFNDASSQSDYRADGATVLLLFRDERYIRVGAFDEEYSDIYNFDFKDRVGAWSSSKSTLMGKVGVYFSDCN